MASNLEELNKDILDENFIKMFKPIIYAQTFLGSVRVNIRYKFVSPPLWIQSAYTFFLIVFSCISFIFYWNHHGVRINAKYIELISKILQMHLGLFLNASIMITNNLINRDSNVKLLLKLQKIDRDLKFIGKARHNSTIHVFIVLSVIFILIYHFCFLIKESFADLSMAWRIPISTMLYSVEDFECVLFMTIMLILLERLSFINKMIDFGTEVRWQQTPLNTQVYENIWQAFDGVVEAIRMTERVFRIYMFLIVTHVFFYHLLAAKKLITTVEIKDFRWSQLIMAPDPLSVRFIMRVILICFIVNSLEGKLFQTNESCLYALEKVENATSRCYIKNIIRVISTVEPMSVFRMFAINSLAIELTALTLKYAIVLLQFAYT